MLCHNKYIEVINCKGKQEEEKELWHDFYP